MAQVRLSNPRLVLEGEVCLLMLRRSKQPAVVKVVSKERDGLWADPGLGGALFIGWDYVRDIFILR